MMEGELDGEWGGRWMVVECASRNGCWEGVQHFQERVELRDEGYGCADINSRK